MSEQKLPVESESFLQILDEAATAIRAGEPVGVAVVVQKGAQVKFGNHGFAQLHLVGVVADFQKWLLQQVQSILGGGAPAPVPEGLKVEKTDLQIVK